MRYRKPFRFSLLDDGIVLLQELSSMSQGRFLPKTFHFRLHNLFLVMMISVGELREILAGLIDPVRASESTQKMKNLKGDLKLIPLLLQLAMSDSEPGRASFLYQLSFWHELAQFYGIQRRHYYLRLQFSVVVLVGSGSL